MDLRLHGAGVDRRVACPERTLVDSVLRLCTDALDSLGGSGGAVTVRITEPEKGRVAIAVDTSAAGGYRTSLDLPSAPAGDPR